MSENKEKEQLDAFSKALLDKKVDMKLHPYAYTQKKQVPMEDRTEAEKSMSSALDMLRLERGQKTIEQEEMDYALSQSKKTSSFNEDDDFTTSSIEQEAEQNNLDLVHTLLQDMSENTNEDEEDLDEDPLYEKLMEKKENFKQKKEIKKKKSKKKKNKKSKNEKKSSKKNKTLTIVLIILFLGLVALGGYTYKVMIYDPQNIVSESQQETYDKLVSYADEYGDNMMSDAEKLELINLDEGYQKLLDKQKTAINTYFKEQTKKSYKALLKEIKALKKSQEESSYPAYQEILNILNSWDTISDVDKMGIVDKQSDFNALPSDLQKSLNKVSNEKTGKNFTDLCSEESTLKSEYEQKQAQEAAQNEQKEQTKASYEQALAQVQANYSAYQFYGESLQQELVAAQQNGEDTTEIQSMIDTNNQMLNELASQIAYYQQQIQELQ